MKKGIAYFAVVLFVAALACSCSSRKAQCGAYSKVEKQVSQTEVRNRGNLPECTDQNR